MKMDRIDKLIETAQRAINGDFSSPIPTSDDNDDIDRLTHAINRLVEVLGRHISEKNRNETASETNEETFRRLTANIPGMIFLFSMRPDETGSFSYVNDASKHLFDISPEDLVQDANRLTGIIHPDDRKKFESSLTVSAETVRPWHDTFRCVVNGTVRWYDCMARPEQQHTGEILWHGIIVEITERKNDEESLRKSLKELSLVMAVSPVGIAIYDREGQCVSTNESLASIIGTTKHHILGQNFNTIESWKQSGLLKKAEEAIRTQSDQRHEVNTVTTFGKEVYLDCHLVPFGDQGLLVMIQDITAPRKASAAFSETTATLRSIYESSPMLIGIVELTDDNKIFHIYDNPATARFFKVPYQGTKLKTADELGAPSEAIREWLVSYRKSQKLNVPVQFDYVHTSPEGPLWLSATVSFIGPGQSGRSRFSFVAEDITERKRVAEEILQSATKFKSLFMSVPDIFFLSEIIHDDNGNPCDYRYLDVNPGFEKFLGLRREEIIGRRYSEHMHFGTTRWLDEYCRSARFGAPRSFQFFSKEYNVHFETYSYQPSPGQVAVFVRDITDRKQTEKELKMSEERLSQAVRVGNIGIFDHDHTDDTFYWSPELLEIYGLEKTPTLQEFITLIHPEDRERIAVAVRRAHDPSGDGLFDVEYRGIRFDGENRWIATRSKTFFEGEDNERHAVRTIGAVRDITEEMVSKEKLQAAKEYAETLLESANAMIVVLDAAGNVQVFNKAAEEITGYSRHDLAGRNWFETLVPKDRFPAVWEIFTKHEQQRIPRSFENPILTKGGDERYISWQNTEIIENGIFQGSISYGIDITRHKELENQLLQSQKIDAIGQLSGGIAHDFNNMLSVILGHSELIKSGLPPGDPLLMNVMEIEHAGRHSRDITRQLLAFSRKQIIEPKPTNLNRSIENIRKTLSSLIGENIELRIFPHKDLWNVRIDPTQVDQIVFNLATNARDAMPKGGTLTIETSNMEHDETYCSLHVECKTGQYVVLSVTDDGVGMDKEMLTHIFEPFWTTKGVGKGTGLGLATVYGITRQNGGFVFVYSEPGIGTTFSIHIPRLHEEIPDMGDIEKSPAAFHPATVLLVEDDDMVRRMTVALLKKFGYTVIPVGSPMEALTFFENGSPPIDLLITDVVMPKISGAELASKIKQINPEIKILFMSGYTENIIDNHGVLKKDTHFIQKPFSKNDLARKIREAIENRPAIDRHSDRSENME
jgi:PAS domain S-box-containing protein